MEFARVFSSSFRNLAGEIEHRAHLPVCSAVMPGISINQHANTVRILGYGGLIPFVMTLLAICFLSGPVRTFSIVAFIAYAAIIYTFIVAVHWGLLIKSNTPFDDSLLLTVSAVAPLVGWGALLLPPVPALLLLALAFPLLFAYEKGTAIASLVPGWYLSMRLWLTVVVTTLILLALAGISFSS
ncbi:MAG: DUF3429 domain-containing protein [Gammaproteobacteria bacterium]|nr:DUF3429 domain-containing protein [Gammaproteobacteria bacterium]